MSHVYEVSGFKGGGKKAAGYLTAVQQLDQVPE